MHIFLMLYCPGTMTSQAESQKFRYTAWTGLTFTTHATEHRTEPVSTESQADNMELQ